MKTDIVNTLLYNRNIYRILKSDNVNEILDKCAEFLNLKTDIIEYNPIYIDNISVSIGHKLRQLCSIYNALLIVKSRCDIADIIHANGVLLDKSSYSPDNAKKLINHDMLIGTEYMNYSADFVLLDERSSEIKFQFIKKAPDLYIRN